MCPWITRDILAVLKSKDSYYNRWKRNKTNEYYRKQFKYYRNKSVAMIRKSKKLYYAKMVTQNKGDTKQLWKIVKNVIGIDRQNKVTPKDISQRVANNFNEYFINVGSGLTRKFPLQLSTTPAPRTVNNNFCFHNISIEDMRASVSKMAVNKASGLDGIQMRVIKENIDIIGPYLCHLFNHSLENSCYPDILKVAKVVPIYKDGDPNEPGSYRPISVLSALNTLFEKLIAQQVKKFLKENNIIAPQQHGFVENRSTSTAVLTLSQALNSAMHQNNIAVVVFLDIKKAFDTVYHPILLQKLESYGFTECTLKFFHSYLSSRKQRVLINGFLSDVKEITCGVPQGSVIGPILFSLYINDLPKALSSSQIIMYADDAALVVSGTCLQEIQTRITSELKNLSSWFFENRLTLNADKTKYVIFHSRYKTTHNYFTLTLGSSLIQQVSHFKYLGVILAVIYTGKNK